MVEPEFLGNVEQTTEADIQMVDAEAPVDGDATEGDEGLTSDEGWDADSDSEYAEPDDMDIDLDTGDLGDG